MAVDMHVQCCLGGMILYNHITHNIFSICEIKSEIDSAHARGQRQKINLSKYTHKTHAIEMKL